MMYNQINVKRRGFMKGLKIFLKFLVLALTAIWGVVFGIVSPLVLMNSGAEYSDNPIFILWLVMAGAGYIDRKSVV